MVSKALFCVYWISFYALKSGLVFDYARREKGRSRNLENVRAELDRGLEKYERDVSRLLFLRANKTAEITALEPTEHRANCLIGNDPSKWRTDIQTSKSVGYKRLYPKIDLKVYGAEKQIEYDWVTGYTSSPDFPIHNVYDSSPNRSRDIFITKFTARITSVDESGHESEPLEAHN